MNFRLIDTGYNTPAMNMAIDEALLISELPVLRFYGWKPAGLSIGYSQPIKDVKQDVPIVRRLTGGNAVLHDKELTYSFIIDEDKMPHDVVESYKEISRGLLQGLENLGLNAYMNKEVEKEKKSAVCFHDPSWYEILVDGKKIIGSAQRRIDGKLLQHGAVLIDADIEKYCSLFNEDMLEKVKARMTSIRQEGVEADYDKVKQAMIKGFEAIGLEFIEDELTEGEIKLAKELEDKYSSDEWNLRR